VSDAFSLEPGGIKVQFAGWQIVLLKDVIELVEASGDDPALPVHAYPDEPEEDAQYRRLLESERSQARAADQSAMSLTLDAAADGVYLSRAEAEAWLRVLGESRLLLASRLGVVDNEWEDDEDSEELAILHYLSWLQASLVEIVSDELPAGGT
jgi:hypothetical protein